MLIDRPQLFIDGAWVDPTDGGVIDVLSPATEEVVGRVGEATPADIDRAVAAARRAFDEGAWPTASPAERATVLRDAAAAIEARSEELVDLLTAELGCPRWYAERAHIPNPIRHLRYYADLIETFEWVEERGDGTNLSRVVSEPIGVVGAITPWNGPMSAAVLKVAPALAAGCAVVSKPSPEAPLSMIAVADALHAAGLPAGIFNLVPGGREAGSALVEHADVDKIAFTGSTAAGKAVMAAAAGTLKRVTLELGGKSAAVVLDDVDLDELRRLLPSMLLMVNGQACIAQSRVLVPRSREAEIVDALAEEFRSVVVGDPFDEGTTVGPLVSEAQRARVEHYLDLARAEGAEVVVGGGRPEGLAHGYYVEPTLIAGATNDMTVAREEIFGPVMTVIAYDDVDEAVAIANDSDFGLSGSVWSADEGRAIDIARRIRTGMVSINGAPQAWGTPFGGVKQSGIGREMGPEGLKIYLEQKSIAVPA